MKPLPTLQDVARVAGVSTATVSRVINDPANVRPSTRDRVIAAVDELGYTPHFGGRALASNRTDTVGAIIPTMENAIFARGLQAVQEELADSGVTLLVATSNYDTEREARQIRTLLSRGVDGLILIGETRPLEIYELLCRRELPFVLVWTWRENAVWPSVGFDNRAAARQVAERVLEFGHRRIAMIAGVTLDNDRALARVEGVRAALAARGLGLDPACLIEAEYRVDAGAAAARELLTRAPQPTAIICGNDVLAIGAMRAIREAGLTVPRDISVTGFDDIEVALLVDPPLTTVHVPHRRMGHAAAHMLLEMRNPGARPNSIRLDVDYVERASLGPPPG